MHRRIGFIFTILVAVWWNLATNAEQLTTSSGYALSYDVYAGGGPEALVFMYGKNGINTAPNMKAFAERIGRVGITVYLPLMPWSRR